ncbi:DoxX family membrane protein [Hyphobacterium sp. HN65]|uniref:DoxX family membrane protein n=1 Tax=Hyphobacterium lacteum TaxID=3116575 RepID=A0ABU7LR40_9PROT|nr:DoxX family membrane protein [Hyphobacterium sp. HN65]MEE2526378.1 DoxX family membrane protein [Hyphobacterium sp. HN65]
MTEAISSAKLSGLTRHSHWLLRAAFAGVFLFHGTDKLMNLEASASMMGLPIAVWALVALAETAAGAGIIAGALIAGRTGDLITRASGFAILPVMLGAIVMVHMGRWSFVPTESHPMGGMEFQVFLLVTGLIFLLRGNEI